MVEYIERRIATNVVGDIDTSHSYDSKDDIIERAIAAIDLIPAADVAPVVHGKWIHTTTEDDDWGVTYHHWNCSNCNRYVGCNPSDMNYCPNCGARMDGGV